MVTTESLTQADKYEHCGQIYMQLTAVRVKWIDSDRTAEQQTIQRRQTDRRARSHTQDEAGILCDQVSRASAQQEHLVSSKE